MTAPLSIPTARTALDALEPGASPADRAKAAAQQDFASILSESTAVRGAPSKPLSQMTLAQQEAQARKVAQDFVAVAFIQPILKQLRNSPMGDLGPPLGPGPGEKQFRTLADTHMAHQLARAANWPLIDQLTRTLQKKKHNPFTKEALAKAPLQPGSPADVRAAAARRATSEPRPSGSGPRGHSAKLNHTGSQLDLLQ